MLGTRVAGEAVLPNWTSADGATGVLMEDELLPMIGSSVGEATVAVLSIPAVKSGATSPMSVTVTELDGDNEEIEQTATRLHVPPATAAEVKVTPAGARSETVTDCADEGPAFATVRVYRTG